MKKIKKTIGIYKITTPIGEIYIGQSTDVERRFSEYRTLQCKTQKQLYYSLLKYGVESHKFEILIQCPESKLDELEQFYIRKFDSYKSEKGLNKTIGGYGVRKKFLSYEESRIWLQENILNDGIITDSKNWFFFTDMIPDFIPKSPKKYYSGNGWISWEHFLQPKCISYDEAKKWIKENIGHLRLNQKNWSDKAHKLPIFIPKKPKEYYLKDWKNWEDFLSKERRYSFLSYEEAKKWLRKNIYHLNLITSYSKWKIHCYGMIPNSIPKNPHVWYKDKGWISWDDFLDLDNLKKQQQHERI